MKKNNGTSTKLNKSAKQECLFEMIQGLADNEFTGYLKVNFTQGALGRLEKFEEIALYRKQSSE